MNKNSIFSSQNLNVWVINQFRVSSLNLLNRNKTIVAYDVSMVVVHQAALKIHHNVKSDFCKWPNYTICDFYYAFEFRDKINTENR